MFGGPTEVTLGSNDSDAFNYDSNTGRMTQYKFTVNSSSVIGNLTWNANGTLQQLAVTDPFNSNNQQTCTYGYDAQVRMASANCVNGSTAVWKQNYSFTSNGTTTGAFGNPWKIATGGQAINFQPTYNQSTNRITSVGTQNYSYDSNGNLTSTGTGTGTAAYAWDADGHMVSDTLSGMAAVNLTYDALGRMIEQGRGTSYQEIVYGTDGSRLALMNGQTLTKAFVPLPAGGTAVYNSSGLAYYRHGDWLGSSRLASTTSRTMYYDAAYAPYGEPYSETGTTDRNFAGLNQDTTSNLYDAMFREHDYTQGRWISPDPAGIAAVDLTDPQTWNRYSYVGNSPTNFVDPLGLCGTGQVGDPPCNDNNVTVVTVTPGGGASTTSHPGEGFGSPGSSSEGGDRPGADPCIVDNQDQDPKLFASLCPEQEASALLAAAADPPQQSLQAAHGCQDKGGGGGGISNFPDNPQNLKLVVTSDTCSNGVRSISYSLATKNGDPLVGAYYISEHNSNATFSRGGPIPNMTTSSNPNSFEDSLNPGLGAVFSGPSTTTQFFSVSMNPNPNSPGVTVPVSGAPGGVNHIFMSGFTTFVNGKQSPGGCPAQLGG